MRKLQKLAALAALSVASGLALADPTTAVDVSAVTSTITAQLVPIGLIGAAVLGIVVAVKAYKWIRAAM